MVFTVELWRQFFFFSSLITSSLIMSNLNASCFRPYNPLHHMHPITVCFSFTLCNMFFVFRAENLFIFELSEKKIHRPQSLPAVTHAFFFLFLYFHHKTFPCVNTNLLISSAYFQMCRDAQTNAVIPQSGVTNLATSLTVQFLLFFFFLRLDTKGI